MADLSDIVSTQINTVAVFCIPSSFSISGISVCFMMCCAKTWLVCAYLVSSIREYLETSLCIQVHCFSSGSILALSCDHQDIHVYHRPSDAAGMSWFSRLLISHTLPFMYFSALVLLIIVYHIIKSLQRAFNLLNRKNTINFRLLEIM